MRTHATNTQPCPPRAPLPPPPPQHQQQQQPLPVPGDQVVHRRRLLLHQVLHVHLVGLGPRERDHQAVQGAVGQEGLQCVGGW